MASGSLGCEVIVYRALTRASDFDKATQQLKPIAFRRRPSDKKGLSVNYGCEPHECGAHLNKRHGIASLHVGHVRVLGIDIVSDVPNHANIVGVPMPEEDPERAEQLAGDLAEQARLKLIF